jgi:hypothetical protein
LAPLGRTWQWLSVDHTPQQAGSMVDFQVLHHPAAPYETLLVDNMTIKITGQTTAVDSLPESGALRARFTPNPMRGAGVIEFTLSRAGAARVEILDLSGRRVRSLLDTQALAPGSHHVPFDGRGIRGERMAAGVYFFRVATPAGAVTRRFAILK